MRVQIRSKQAFDDYMEICNITNDNVETIKDTMFISINDSCGTDEKPYFQTKDNVLVLFFDDVEEDIEVPIIGTGEILTVKAFTENQAKEIIDFIERHKDKKLCLVHCQAGVSRSGAVGTFINDYFKGNVKDFKEENRYISPNKHVLNILNNYL